MSVRLLTVNVKNLYNSDTTWIFPKTDTAPERTAAGCLGVGGGGLDIFSGQIFALDIAVVTTQKFSPH